MNILLISGHGAGDPGAVSTIDGTQYREADETRRVTSALQEILKKTCNVSIYPVDRNAYKDCKSGVLASKANFSKYDYVLEIHFNASQSGPSDGKTKGVECYVTTSESGTTVEQKICQRIASVGLKDRGVKRYNWAVINTARRSGVSSALLEVCFIDDPDDMRIYNQNFQKIVNAIAEGIADGFGIKMEIPDTSSSEEVNDDMTVYKTLSEIPTWGKATVEKLISKGYLKGEDGNGSLNLEENMLRGLVINDRAGLYDLK